jgi:GMP synthase-like glutamine amidotransferase
MNNGVANEATRCFRRLFEGFSARVRAANPGLDIHFRHVQPRNLGELPDGHNVDLVLSSGGPGSPFDGYEDPWCTGYRKFLDLVIEKTLQDAYRSPALFVVCHSFEIAINHFGFAQMTRRDNLKFGVMPCYTTEEGRRSPLFEAFGDRLFVWEHRRWQATDLDEKKLKALGGQLLAVESRPGGEIDKGRGLLGFNFAPGIVGTQFHPEADRPGVMAWVNRPEHAADLKDAYGESLYERMLKTLSDPTRLARTYALLIPGWLTYRFNQLALERGLRPIAPPEQDMRNFEDAPQVAV